MKKLKKVLKIIITILLVLILIYNFYNFISLKVIKKDLATVGGYSLLEVVSTSMEPTIKKGDLIIINTRNKNYYANNIVTYYDEENNFVTHRIVKIKDEEVVTKGDNNDSEDKEISIDKIVGKYVFKIAYLGTIFRVMRNPIVLIIIFVIGVLVCVLMSDKEEYKEFQEYLIKKKEETVNISVKKKRKKSNKKKKKKWKKKRR